MWADVEIDGGGLFLCLRENISAPIPAPIHKSVSSQRSTDISHAISPSPQNAKNLRKDSRTRDPIPAGFRLCARPCIYVYYSTPIYLQQVFVVS
jgi:hypothetical protein